MFAVMGLLLAGCVEVEAPTKAVSVIAVMEDDQTHTSVTDEGVWSKALGSSAYFAEVSLYNSTSKGMNFSGKFGPASTIWYPASGYRPNDDGVLDNVGNDGECWSASPRTGNGNNGAFYLYFRSIGNVHPANYGYRAYGSSVRCLQIIDEVAEL